MCHGHRAGRSLSLATLGRADPRETREKKNGQKRGDGTQGPRGIAKWEEITASFVGRILGACVRLRVKGLILVSQYRRKPLDPTAVWRWGFTVALVALGIWLVIANPAIGGANGKLMGWIVIGYGLLRLLLNRLIYPVRGKHGLHR